MQYIIIQFFHVHVKVKAHTQLFLQERFFEEQNFRMFYSILILFFTFKQYLNTILKYLIK